MFLISVITFLSINALGIDVARNAIGRQATEEQVAAFNEEHDLTGSLAGQYLGWVGSFVQGDWGDSPLTGRPVRDDAQPALFRSLILAGLALGIALPIGLVLGIFLAQRPNSRHDLWYSVLTVTLAAVPAFVMGLILILIFGVELGWLPVDSTLIAFGGAGDQIRGYVLPTLTLVLLLLPHFTRITRAAYRDTLSARYAHAAVLRGLPSRTIVWRHLLPNAAGPIINVVALEMIALVGGVIVVENVFGFPGIGQLLVSSITNGDLIAVQSIAMVTALLFICFTLMADLIAAYFNPRLRR